MSEEKVKAYVLGSRIIAWDEQRGPRLYKEGYYGKFVGISKPKELDIERPVELSLVEALYLLERGRIEVIDHNGKNLKPDELRELARKAFDMFDDVYEVYKDLRAKGYVVRPGLKFGSTFAVYRYGPGIDHAPFLVHVMPYEAKLDPIEIVKAGRLSHSVRKRFILATVHPKTREIRYYMFKWFKA